MIGQTIGRYRILAHLGEGGMGSVWMAEDPLLERRVALKFLPEAVADEPEARQRFLREAQAASRLDHPGIATVFDAGEVDGRVYIAIKIVEGTTVAERVAAGPLPVPECARIAARAAEALAHAHAQGVLHRDVTSRNIMVARGDGRVVLVDFGLALPEWQTRLTRSDVRMGTVAYMAPEVVRGGSADRRSDVYGLGVVLFEMLTGQQPFRGAHAEAVLYAAAHEPPEAPSQLRPDVPPALEALVLEALAKDPDARPESAGEFAARIERTGLLPQGTVIEAPPVTSEATALRFASTIAMRVRDLQRPRRWTLGWTLAALAVVAAALVVLRLSPAGRAPDRIAVLPFQDVGEDPEAFAYRASGLAAALSTKLTQIAGLTVVPWTTVQRYAGDTRPMPDLARELGADVLVVGTIREIDGRIQVGIGLVNGRSGLQTWAREFDHDSDDVFTAERDIATQTALALRGRLRGDERQRLERDASKSPEAYIFYLRGAELLQEGGRAATEEARALFERAVHLDPGLAEAHVGIGSAEASLEFFQHAEATRSLERADAAYRRALAIDPGTLGAYRGLVRLAWRRDEPEACLQLGRQIAERVPQSIEQLLGRGEAYFMGDLDDRAQVLLRRVIDADPANVAAHWFLVLSYVADGRFEAGIDAGKVFLEKFGDDAEIHLRMGIAYEHRGDFAAAARHFDTALALLPEDSVNYFFMFAAVFDRHRGDLAASQARCREAVRRAEAHLRLYPDDPNVRSALALHLAFLGDRDGFEREWSRVLELDPTRGCYSYAYAALGDLDRALECWEEEARHGRWSFFQGATQFMRVFFPALDSEPRYVRLAEEHQRFRESMAALY